MTLACGMEIALGSPDDLDGFVELLEEAGAWLWSREIPQWPPGSNRAQTGLIQSQLERGALLCLRDPAEVLVGGCLLCREPYEAWRDLPGEAAYLHKLVVARSAAGCGWGARIVEHAERWTVEQGRALLRLDCWDGSVALRAYHRALGFTELDAVREHGYEVRLFEKKLGAPS